MLCPSFIFAYHDISIYHEFEQPFVFNNQIHYASEPVSRSTTVQPLKRFSLSFVSLPRNMSFPPIIIAQTNVNLDPLYMSVC